jgi:hypothetical protein
MSRFLGWMDKAKIEENLYDLSNSAAYTRGQFQKFGKLGSLSLQAPS